ncbi:hypothetical protein V6N11_047867 [Hibiscus sabdariffa]|uniref:Uncharacterized protein n=2 Tax=Hibiscus sabdariffa TaxID=183260 RepID=A0ABR2BHH6_9ROSI
MVVSGSFAGCTGKAWCSFAGRTVVALCSLVGSTMVALCSFVGSTGVALCSFGGSTVVAPVGRVVLPVPLAGRENAGRAWLGCPQASWRRMMVWCASSGTPMPLLATMLVTALVVGSTLSRPVTVVGAVIGCLAWRPSLFSWCASKLTGAVFLSIACPGVAPFPWPINLVVVEAFFAEGSILGVDAPPDAPDAPVALAQKGPSLSASPSKFGLSKSAPAGLRRAAMPAVPEHQEFDEWCAARSHTPPANVAGHPAKARASSIPPPRPHKRQASSSDPSRAKRSRASSSSSTRIPSTSKAGMSSVNNSPAETALQSRREK